ncbi:MAG: hypothetical protein M3Z13_07555 [Candidatus Dormibacteraeota bacterium]|nr:hypothetical protein [Candidatus Dormibacteraeota bacterium]
MLDATWVAAGNAGTGRGFMGLLRRDGAFTVLERRLVAAIDEDDLSWALPGLDYLARETGPVQMADLELLRQRVMVRLRDAGPR